MAEEYVTHLDTRGPFTDFYLAEVARGLDVPVNTLKRYRKERGFPTAGTTDEMKAWITKQSAGMKKKHLRKRKGFTEPKPQQISTETRNNYLTTCRMVFEALAEDAGLSENPFGRVAKLQNHREDREAFTPDDLRKIGNASDGWVRTLFLVGLCSGLREEDICTLRWREVDPEQGWITRRMKKTRKIVQVPILPQLADCLRPLPRDGEYCFPELADRYLNHRTTIGWHVTQFLEELGIQKKRKVEGRSRAVSVKDVHSCRHTFCYLAALNNVPLPIVQSVVGHMSAEMTKRYMDHATQDAKRAALSAIPDYVSQSLSLPGSSPAKQTARDRLIQWATDTTEEQAAEWLATLGLGPAP